MHPGVTKTMMKLSDKYWFPRMRQEVERHIRECGSCQMRKDPKVPLRVPLMNQMATSPFEVLSVDFKGPLVESESGMKNILVFTCHFTKWCELFPTKDQTAATVAKLYVEQVFCRYGASKVLISDNGKCFISEMVAEVNRILAVEHRFTTAYHPQTNGQVEVYNRTLSNMLSHVIADNQRDWDKFIPFCQLAHNSS